MRGSTEKIPEEFEDRPSDMNDKHAVLSVPVSPVFCLLIYRLKCSKEAIFILFSVELRMVRIFLALRTNHHPSFGSFIN